LVTGRRLDRRRDLLLPPPITGLVWRNAHWPRASRNRRPGARPGLQLGGAADQPARRPLWLFAIPIADVPPVRLWALNVGFYNLFLAGGSVAGVIAWSTGAVTVGRTLVLYVCLFMFLAGIILFISDRLALSRPEGKGVGGAVSQSAPPLMALVAAWL
jgi:putative membrane protein